MANEGGNEILITPIVDNSQAVPAVEKLTDAVEGAEEATGVLNKTLEKTDVVLGDLGAAAKISAAGLQQLGFEVKDLGDGQVMLTKATGDATGAGQSQVVVTDEQAVAMREAAAAAKAEAAELALVTDALNAYIERIKIATVETTTSKIAADANLGSLYTGMSKLEALGTPAILKAATWSILGVGGIAYEGIKQYMNFNKLITQSITQAGVNPKNMNFLTQTAESISTMSGVNLTDVANSLYRVASGTASWNNGLGATKKQLADITKSVTNLQVLGNVAGGATSEQAARVITALINANMKGIGNSPTAAGALINAVIGAGDIRMSDLVPAIGRGLLSSAKANNVSAKDALSWVDVLTSLGTTGSVAGNYVKTGINLLSNPSAQGATALAMLGIKPGEMQGLMSGPGGLRAAVSTLIAGMKKFNPGGIALYRNNIGNVRAGGAGTPAAINKLETWAVGELPASFIAAWQKGQLTPAQQAQANTLILTKAFGGSKQFATIAALTGNFSRLLGVEQTIARNDTSSQYNRSVQMALNTPSQRFHKDLSKMQVDLVKAGQALYPVVIKLTDAFTWVFNAFTTWKPLLFELGAAMAAVVGIAAVVKGAAIGKGVMSMGGGILDRFWKNGNKLTGHAKLDNGLNHLRNIYRTRMGMATSGENEASMVYGNAPTAALGRDLQTVNGTIGEVGKVEIDLLGRILEVLQASSFRGAGSSEAKGLEGDAQKEESKLSGWKSDLYHDHRSSFNKFSGLGRKGRSTAVSDAERLRRGGTIFNQVEGSADTAAKYTGQAASGAEGAVGSALTADAGGGITKLAGGGLLEGLSGLGGPVGMMAMTLLTPMVMPLLMSATRGLFSSLSGWFGGAKRPAPPTTHPQTTFTDAKTALGKAEKALQKLEVYNKKTGKWSYNYNLNAKNALYEQEDREKVIKLGGVVAGLAKHPDQVYRNAYDEPAKLKSLMSGVQKLWQDPNIEYGSQAAAVARNALLKGTSGNFRSVLNTVLDDTLNDKGKYGYLASSTPGEFQSVIRSMFKNERANDHGIVQQAISLGNDELRGILPGEYNYLNNGLSGIMGRAHGVLHYDKAYRKLSKQDRLGELTSFRNAANQVYNKTLSEISKDAPGSYAYIQDKQTAAKAKADTEQFTKMIAQLEKNKSIKIDPDSMSGIKKSYIEALQAQDLSAEKMADALLVALHQGGRSLAGIVNNANKPGTGAS